MATLDRSQILANHGRITPFLAWSNRFRQLGEWRAGHRIHTAGYAERWRPHTAGVGSALPMDTPGFSLDPQTVTMVNSEASYIANLYRSMTGQPPLPPAMSAPSVNVGIDPATQKLLIAGALGALLLLMRKRR